MMDGMSLTPSELEARVSLSFLRGMESAMARRMEDAGMMPEDIYSLSRDTLCGQLGVNPKLGYFSDEERLAAIERARREVEFMKHHRISCISLFDDDYPTLVREAPDAPVNIFKIGKGQLEGGHFLSLVGSRRPTPYGAEFCRTFVGEAATTFPDITVVSGLAYGIDSMSHQAALDNNIPTIAVLAHGLDIIYPAANRDLAARIVRAGGALISEYPSGTPPFRMHFLQRNRIIAALCELTIVVESECRGGAMNTANTANSYFREVMAVPGRVTDRMSAGCNMLIHQQKAHILTGVSDIADLMGWQKAEARMEARQRQLFTELTGDRKTIHDALRAQSDPVSIDTLRQTTGIPIAALAALLMEMEFDGQVMKYPGARYGLS